jgi:hypothetical protein
MEKTITGILVVLMVALAMFASTAAKTQDAIAPDEARKIAKDA